MYVYDINLIIIQAGQIQSNFPCRCIRSERAKQAHSLYNIILYLVDSYNVDLSYIATVFFLPSCTIQKYGRPLLGLNTVGGLSAVNLMKHLE